MGMKRSKTAMAMAAIGAAAIFSLALMVVLAQSSAHKGEVQVDERGIQVTTKEDGFLLKVPVENLSHRVLGVKLSIQLLDFDDKSLWGAERDLTLRWKHRVYTFPLNVEGEDLHPNRLKYHLTFPGGESVGIVSLSEVMNRLETHVLGQTEFLSGGHASIRVITLNHRGKRPIEGAHVRVQLGDQELFKGRTNEQGTVDASFLIPEKLEGQADLAITASTPIGEDVIVRKVKTSKQEIIYLITDKPVYQPNQIIHIRALSLRKPNLKPAERAPITLEVEDSKGNKVFKKSLKTDRFGIASADFQLADEVNLGPYKVRAILENSKSEKTVTVKRYVLPKYKIEFTTDKKYYLPGEKVTGEIQADYFFGKPVAGGLVEMTLSKFDVGFTEVATIDGVTDKKGHFRFQVQLPEYFVGQPLEQGDAFVKFEVSVIDQAQHQEKLTETRTVSRSPIRIVIIPESGQVVPGISNLFYVMTTYPDGSPSKTSVTLNGLKRETDDLGIAKFSLTPEEEGGLEVQASSVDEKGNKGDVTVRFEYDSGLAHLLLRTDQALYEVGGRMKIQVLATRDEGIAYIDLVKDHQTVLTKSVGIQKGMGSLEVDLTADLTGSLWLHAYMITGTSDIIRDTKVTYVNPANDLRITIGPNRQLYRPGEEGWIDFEVSDSEGHPVLAALGIAVVDEAVFALTELQPGMEKVYFTLERELLEPRYEIHGFTPPVIVGVQPLISTAEQQERRQEAASVIFASFTEPPRYGLRVNTYEREEPDEKLRARIQQDGHRLRSGVQQYQRNRGRYPSKEEGLQVVVDAGLLMGEDLLDPWMTPYQVVTPGQDLSWFQILSWGPDKHQGTDDDLDESGLFGRAKGEFAEGMLQFDAERMAPRAGVMIKSALSVPAPAERKGVEPRVREYFPETLLFEPALITDERGKARLDLKWADSITKWRLTSSASSAQGELGSQTAGITVFQDFFVDLDLPVSLTQNDQVSIPVAVYNYLKRSQRVQLELQLEPWFELMDEATKERDLEENEVSVVHFKIKAKEIGAHKLTVKAYGQEQSDAISRSIEVVPDGQEHLVSVSDRLKGDVARTVYIPAEAIAGASKIFVKVFPGIFSQIVDGLDSMLRMPFGCFEQTSSVTYPNILILDYMRQTEQISPEIEMKAEGYINVGYQRLLTFEVSGGGFEWFGNAPANKILTAWGLMEFEDMSKVFEVDPDIVARTQRWLVSKQDANGSWSPDENYLHGESWGRIQSSELLPTAYIAWSLLETGNQGEAASKAVIYIRENLAKAEDPYMLALCANALVAYDREDMSTTRAFELLMEKKVEENGVIFWRSEIPTFTHSRGKGADIETTALVAHALIKSGRYSEMTNKVMTYLVRSKNPDGTWGSTQGTILALRALLASLKGSAEDIDATVTVAINGAEAESFKLTPENADVIRLVDLKELTRVGKNEVKLRFEGQGSSLYEIVTRYYLPWEREIRGPEELLSIDVDYDKTELQTDDLVTSLVKITNNRPGIAHMVIVDLGIPPGFEVQTPDLNELVGREIERYSLTGRQIIIYLDKLEGGHPVEFSYRLRAKFPIRAKTPTSKVYEYYNPDIQTLEQPIEMIVR
jgi:hypothetical protein